MRESAVTLVQVEERLDCRAALDEQAVAVALAEAAAVEEAGEAEAPPGE